MRKRREDFDSLYNEDGTCHQWDCGKQGVILAYDDFNPEVALWFCLRHWNEEDEWLEIVEDRRGEIPLYSADCYEEVYD